MRGARRRERRKKQVSSWRRHARASVNSDGASSTTPNQSSAHSLQIPKCVAQLNDSGGSGGSGLMSRHPALVAALRITCAVGFICSTVSPGPGIIESQSSRSQQKHCSRAIMRAPQHRDRPCSPRPGCGAWPRSTLTPRHWPQVPARNTDSLPTRNKRARDARILQPPCIFIAVRD